VNALTDKKVALITGASSGFGHEFAKLFAKDKHNLLLVALPNDNLPRVAEELRAEFGVAVHTLELDLTALTAGETIQTFIEREGLQVTHLVNNAGMGIYGKFANVALKTQRVLLELNMGILTELCHRLIPHMIANGGGRILNVASMAAFQPGPYYATYYASKGYVLLLSEALREEYARDGIVISTLCPGPSPTNFFKEHPKVATSWLMKLYMLPPARIAQMGYRGLMRGQNLIIPGLVFKFIPFGARFVPRVVVTKLSARLVGVAAKDVE
jgi:short-subunit dehydrogenase